MTLYVKLIKPDTFTRFGFFMIFKNRIPRPAKTVGDGLEWDIRIQEVILHRNNVGANFHAEQCNLKIFRKNKLSF